MIDYIFSEELYLKDEILDRFNSILYFISKLQITDLDISTNDYLKIKVNWEVISILEYEPNYISKLGKQYIKSKEGTKEYEEEKKELLLEIKKLKDIKMSYLSVKITKKFIDSFIQYWLTDLQRENFLKDYSLDFSISKEFSNFRINMSFHTLEEWIWVFLSIRKINKLPFSIQEMNITETIKNKFTIPNWLIIISWPTSNAKSSTLITMLNWINENYRKKIMTIEDPIEFYFSNLQKKSTFRQREIWKTCLTFKDWLVDAVRQDPQIIVIWEIRDADTLVAAINAAETWKLVISTLHTDSTTESLNRILGFFEWSKLTEVSWKLAWVLKFILNQRMVSLLNWEVKIAYEWLDTEQGWIKNLIKSNTLDDLRWKMYEINLDGYNPHKTLNESLFELIVQWLITIDAAKEKYSNELSRFDWELKIYINRYSNQKGISLDEIQENILKAKEIEKRKINKI